MPVQSPADDLDLAGYPGWKLLDPGLRRWCGPPELHPPGGVLVQEGDPGRLWVILSGWASEQVRLTGGRHLVRILLPGDLAGLGEAGGPAALDVVALTTAAASGIRIAAPSGDAAGALRTAREARERQLVEQIVRLTRLSALERTADFFLSLFQRLSAAGLTTGNRLPMPLTQKEVASFLGLSSVHFNRILRTMKADGLLEWRAGGVALLDAAGLALVCRRPIAAS